jgi:hypothetical protein
MKMKKESFIEKYGIKISMAMLVIYMLIFVPKTVIKLTNGELLKDYNSSVSNFWCQSKIPSDAYKYASSSDLQKLQDYYHGTGDQPINPIMCNLVRWLEG